MENLDDVIRLLDLLGVFFNAILGGVLARAHRLDAVGFAVLAIMSGLGGGIIRDTLLQAGPPVALTDTWYLLVALAGAGVAFVIRIEGRIWDRAFAPIDALAVGLWATVGAQKALGAGLGPMPAILLGVITAVGGGFTRDVVLRRIPGILGGTPLYATCAFAAALVMVLFSYTDAVTLGSLAATVVGTAFVLLARHRGWMLPPGAGWKPPRPRAPSLRRRRRPMDDAA
ncbi:trimeric intracellular cation channel family protein [Pseudactinotalea sp. HY160]|uniref:trimeric intracellular cation channel family protein n=1 Tax=Pseudactinotalea sp. HY160 TaxID=2654490 RepID=UPI0013125616|nr:trimeric intracellular cation channel family protein [Pseudactinotalea sp. HY160]